jgi:hypothetical protein
MPRYLAVLFDLGMAEQKLDSPRITGAPVDQSSLRASERVCSEKPWIQPNAANPLRNEARVLPRCHAAFGTTTTCEQERAGPFVGGLQIIIDGFAGLFAQFPHQLRAPNLMPVNPWASVSVVVLNCSPRWLGIDSPRPKRSKRLPRRIDVCQCIGCCPRLNGAMVNFMFRCPRRRDEE